MVETNLHLFSLLGNIPRGTYLYYGKRFKHKGTHYSTIIA